MKGKFIIISAPSGSGKSTIIQYLDQQGLNLAFSISATTRQPRGDERHGVHYFFITPEEFARKIENDEFVEYEHVYEDISYGTLKEYVNRLTEEGKNVVFDVDVKGGCRLKKYFGNRALSLFIQPPSVEELRNRLLKRNTDSLDKIEQRVARAEYELSFAPKFDAVVVNDDLAKAQAEALAHVKKFLES